jgi:hypothetical protein
MAQSEVAFVVRGLPFRVPHFRHLRLSRTEPSGNRAGSPSNPGRESARELCVLCNSQMGSVRDIPHSGRAVLPNRRYVTACSELFGRTGGRIFTRSMKYTARSTISFLDSVSSRAKLSSEMSSKSEAKPCSFDTNTTEQRRHLEGECSQRSERANSGPLGGTKVVSHSGDRRPLNPASIARSLSRTSSSLLIRFTT